MSDRRHRDREARRDPDAIPGPTAVPGRRTLVDQIRWPSDSIDRIRSLIATARRDLGVLTAAIAARSFGSALSRADYLRNTLGALREQLADSGFNDRRADLTREVDDLEAAAAPVLVHAPAAPDDRDYARAERVWLEQRLPAAQAMVARAAALLGIAPAPVVIDDHARARTDAHGADAVMSDGDILLHPTRFDPSGAGAFETIAHELVHVAQLAVEPGGPTDDHGDRDAETEAAEIAGQVAAGRAPARPAVRLRAREAADAKKPKPGPRLPTGVDYQPVGRGGDILISLAWFAQGGPANGAADLSQTEVRAPAKVPHLLRALKPIFWWMTDSMIDAAKDMFLHGPIDPSTKVYHGRFGPKLLTYIGLPPGSKVEWVFEQTEASEIISVELLEYVEDLPDGERTMRIPLSVEDASDKRLYEKAGLPRPRIQMVVGERTGPVDKSMRAIVTRFPASTMRALLGPRWDEIAKQPRQDKGIQSPLFEGIAFAPALSIEDREYFVAWAKRVYGTTTGVGAPADAAIILTLRRIDMHPLKDKILARLKATSPNGTQLDWVRLDRLIHDVEQEAVHEQHGVLNPSAGGEGPPPVHFKPAASARDADAAGAPRARYYERPITGEVVNLGSLASVGKELELYFSTTDPQGIGFVSVSVQWIATPIGKPTPDRQIGLHQSLRPPQARQVEGHVRSGWPVPHHCVRRSSELLAGDIQRHPHRDQDRAGAPRRGRGRGIRGSGEGHESSRSRGVLRGLVHERSVRRQQVHVRTAHRHNHPGPKPSTKHGSDKNTTKDLNVPEGGKTFAEIIDDKDNALKAGIVPSVHDIHAISSGNTHVIYTRYVHVGEGKIVNPGPHVTGDNVALHLAGARVIRMNRGKATYIFEVSVQVKDASGKPLWTGPMWVEWNANSRTGQIYLNSKPGTGEPKQGQPGWEELPE